ncbi:peptidase M23 [Desulforamulus profundi]|uniref:Peptidase M23 n=1 Tax=Desulforamulus profundi TaxID=1383067 RepID=A0A2C6LMM9_9FIRM|nr:M23 family metallopeptidase [Desulforamulus profundi]PHJ39860.1 peptidase M23 [Desulforamulus profundi]
MWPFEDSLRNKLRNQDLIKKYRDWLRKWLYRGNKINPFTLMGILVTVALLSAYGFYSWFNGPSVQEAVTSNNTNQVINQDYQKAPPACDQSQANSASQPVETKETSVQPELNPEEMIKPVMGHALTGVGMTFSELFKDYRYHNGVALAAGPGAEVKVALPGTVSLISTGEDGTNTVSINHGSGWESSYSGLDQVNVKAGQKLAQNEVLGTLGKYSRTNGIMENHLYFKVTKNGEPVDPNIYWK